MPPFPSSVLALIPLAALAGCAGLPADSSPPAAVVLVPAQWQAPLPHDGQARELARWWEQFNDPLLDQLIASAQAQSPTIAAAGTRIAQARAARVGAGAALAPTVDAGANVSRGRPDLSLPLGNTASAALQASWELDLFGGNRAGRGAAQERLAGAEAGWHDARVAVAAEVGNAYTGLRACEAQLEQTRLDAASRAETARLTDLAMRAGFQPPAAAALARATAAQGRATVTQQQAECDRALTALVALTGTDQAALRAALAGATGRLPEPAALDVPAVPAAALAQRPDIFGAAREVVAASRDVTQAVARRYPRIGLAGNIGAARFDSSAGNLHGSVWSIGPVSVTLPVFDAGVRRADVAAARARYDESVIAYGARLRNAVREVEEALISLQSTAARNDDARIAAESFLESYRATESRYRGGLANLFELEDARRSALLAQTTLIDLQRERVTAWISLYRALGGGWRTPAAMGEGGSVEGFRGDAEAAGAVSSEAAPAVTGVAAEVLRSTALGAGGDDANVAGGRDDSAAGDAVARSDRNPAAERDTSPHAQSAGPAPRASTPEAAAAPSR